MSILDTSQVQLVRDADTTPVKGHAFAYSRITLRNYTATCMNFQQETQTYDFVTLSFLILFLDEVCTVGVPLVSYVVFTR